MLLTEESSSVVDINVTIIHLSWTARLLDHRSSGKQSAFDADYTICVKGKLTPIEKRKVTGYYGGIYRTFQGDWSRHRRLRGLISF